MGAEGEEEPEVIGRDGKDVDAAASDDETDDGGAERRDARKFGERGETGEIGWETGETGADVAFVLVVFAFLPSFR